MRQISAFRRYCRRYRLLEHRQRPHRPSHYRHHHSHSHAMPHTVQNTPKITTFFDAFPQYLSLQNCTKHSSASIQHAPTFQTHRRSSTLSTSYLFLHKACSKCAMVRADCRLRAHALKGGDPILRVLRRTAPRRLSTKPFNTISTPFPTFDSVSIARFIGDID